MRLYQLKPSPHRSLYVNDQGKVLYKTDTPHGPGIRNQVTVISKMRGDPAHSAITIPLPPPAGDECDPDKEAAGMDKPSQTQSNTAETWKDDKDEENGEWSKFDDAASRKSGSDPGQEEEYPVALQDQLEPIARIEWSLFGSSVFDWDGKKTRTSDFFKRSGFSMMGPGKVWQAPDGKSYKWEMNWLTPKLVLADDPSKPPIVHFHRHVFHRMRPNNKPREWLDISPEAEGILDAILVTYVYVERVRKNRERATRSGGGGGGGNGGG